MTYAPSSTGHNTSIINGIGDMWGGKSHIDEGVTRVPFIGPRATAATFSTRCSARMRQGCRS
jgi:hypothetical protein